MIIGLCILQEYIKYTLDNNHIDIGALKFEHIIVDLLHIGPIPPKKGMPTEFNYIIRVVLTSMRMRSIDLVVLLPCQ